MPVQQTENSILFYEDLPRRFGLGGVFVALGGLLMTAISIYGFFYLTGQPRLAFVACGLIGFSFFLSPFLDHFSSTHTTKLDFASRKVTIEKKSFMRHSVKAYEFDGINRFNVEEDTDIDRWGLQMELKSGKQIQVRNSWVRDQNLCHEIIESANSHLL